MSKNNNITYNDVVSVTYRIKNQIQTCVLYCEDSMMRGINRSWYTDYILDDLMHCFHLFHSKKQWIFRYTKLPQYHNDYDLTASVKSIAQSPWIILPNRWTSSDQYFTVIQISRGDNGGIIR